MEISMTDHRPRENRPTPSDADAAPSKDNRTATGGEDEASTEREGDDRHLHEDQKSRRLKP